jgi:DNA polymerase
MVAKVHPSVPFAAPSSPVTGLASLASLRERCGACERCGLAAGRQQVVISRGEATARLMLIGEAPGAQEDGCGQPFVGRAGQLLDQLLAGADLDSARDAYLCNVIKCRPPANRRPSGAEIAACRPWLEEQIAAVDPPLILLLGATALAGVLGVKQGLSRLRGQWMPWQGRWLMPLFHPSYLLRFPNEAEGSPRWLTRADLAAVRLRLNSMEPVHGGRPPPLAPVP